MPLSRKQIISNGQASQALTFNFDYLSQADIKVFVDEVLKTQGVDYTFANANEIDFASHPAAGAIIRIERQTPNTARTVDFQDGAVLSEADLDNSAKQNFFIAQEAIDTADESITLANDDKWDAESKVIKNVADPVNNTDAVNKQFISTNLPNITTVAGIASDVTNLAAAATDIGTVAGQISPTNNISAVAAKVTEIGRLGTADAVADMNTLGTSAIVADMDTLADIASDITTVAGKASLITSDFVSDLNTVAVTDVINDINTLATSDIVSDLNTLATTDIVSDLNTLATSDIVSDINTLATSDIVTDLNLLATSDFVADLNTMATAQNVSDLNDVAAAITNINTTATNISGVNSFAERYRVGSSDPTSSLDAGDLFYNTSTNLLKRYNGSAWITIASGLTDVVADTTPSLGGNLDVSGNSIVSTSNGNISITPNGSGKVILDGLSHPTSDGSAGQFLKTDGGGNLSFDTVTTDLSGDSTPQLGGNLDVVTHSIVSTSNRDITINPNGTGNVLLGNYEFDADQSVGSGQDNYVLTYDNSTGHISLEVAAAGGGATGGGSDEIFYENGQTVTTNYTITNGKNAMSAGPITIDSGVTVTVGTGETWTVI